MIGVGVIGYGYWGPNLARNVLETPGARLVGVSDLRAERLALATQRHPGILVTRDHRELLRHPDVDAMIIATPVSSHYRLGLEALEAGKHLLLEKPLAATSEEAQALVEVAQRRNLTLLVDHTFVYTGAVRKIHELVVSGTMGQIYYCDAVRINLGLFQHDVNVVWDLAVHDLAILDHILPGRPRAVSATGIRHVSQQPENIAYLTLFYDGDLIAHVHVNWLAPVKVRRMLIGAEHKMLVYDDLEPTEKIKVYDKGVTVNEDPEAVYRMLVGYRTGDMWAPQVDVTEALRTEMAHFIRCIEAGERPIAGGEAGLRVVNLLEAATQSLAQRGRPVALRPDGQTKRLRRPARTSAAIQ